MRPGSKRPSITKCRRRPALSRVSACSKCTACKIETKAASCAFIAFSPVVCLGLDRSRSIGRGCRRRRSLNRCRIGCFVRELLHPEVTGQEQGQRRHVSDEQQDREEQDVKGRQRADRPFTFTLPTLAP